MIKKIKSFDTFSKNILLVFTGASLVNLFNLIYQLIIAHRLNPVDFAAFNSLLAIFVLISSPLATVQTVIAKYTAEFNARAEINKIKNLFAYFLKNTISLAIAALVIFSFISPHIISKLKISSNSSGYILAILVASSCIVPVLSGALQGLELFKWYSFISVFSGVLKLVLAFIFILLGFNIAGALGALLVVNILTIVFSYLPLRQFLSYRAQEATVNFKEIFAYFFPVAVTSFCFMNLVSSDMILVKYFFSSVESGLYSLAQMVGKIFFFLPASISLVMFPRTSGLNAQNKNTVSTLKRSLLYAFVLCLGAGLFYNLFPSVVLKVLTGKVFAESVALGRLFSISMSFFALLSILITYFLSLEDLRFIKYLALSTVLQVLMIILFHQTLMQVQFILLLNSFLLLMIHLGLAFKNKNYEKY